MGDNGDAINNGGSNGRSKGNSEWGDLGLCSLARHSRGGISLKEAQMTDAEVLDAVKRIRDSRMEINIHPLDDVAEFLRQRSDKQQLQRLYGCKDPQQAAGRATHGDAFRM